MLGILKKRLARLRQRPVAVPSADVVTPRVVGQPPAADEHPDWSRLRAPVREQDLSLSALAQKWLAERAPGAAPKALAMTYPRILNRLALCWSDPELVVLVLDSLLVDKRGGRKGFPRTIDQELRALHVEATRLVSQRPSKARVARRQLSPGRDTLASN